MTKDEEQELAMLENAEQRYCEAQIEIERLRDQIEELEIKADRATAGLQSGWGNRLVELRLARGNGEGM